MKKQKNNTVLKIFLWLFLFPFMLTFWGWKNKKKPVLIIGIVLSLILISAAATNNLEDTQALGSDNNSYDTVKSEEAQNNKKALDALQKLYINIGFETSLEDIQKYIEAYDLAYTIEEDNHEARIKIGFDKDVTAFKYASSGDYIELKFHKTGDFVGLGYIDYFNHDAFVSITKYAFGTYWDLRDSSEKGYYTHVPGQDFASVKNLQEQFNWLGEISKCTYSSLEGAYLSLEQNEKDQVSTETKETEGTENSQDQTEEVVEFSGYTYLEVEGGDLSGYRAPLVVVDIGFGDRKYYAFTNAHGQLVRVIADEIIPQDERTEPVTSEGRYYPDEAKVPGTESAVLDEGHVIADSLGGVANAYNITPQDSNLNRNGDQAYMEKVIRDACYSGLSVTNFEAIITYPNTETQIPSHYNFTYTLKGEVIIDEFDNVNPEAYTSSKKDETQETAVDNTEPVGDESNANNEETHDISSIDTNGNGTVTIKEAEAAGFIMPITSDHWLYPYMIDRDGDGMVGE